MEPSVGRLVDGHDRSTMLTRRTLGRAITGMAVAGLVGTACGRLPPTAASGPFVVDPGTRNAAALVATYNRSVGATAARVGGRGDSPDVILEWTGPDDPWPSLPPPEALDVALANWDPTVLVPGLLTAYGRWPDGQLRALPYALGHLVCLVDEIALASLDVPDLTSSVDAFTAFVRTVTAVRPGGLQALNADQLLQPQGIAAFVAGYGGTFVDGAGRLQLTAPATMAALRALVDIVALATTPTSQPGPILPPTAVSFAWTMDLVFYGMAPDGPMRRFGVFALPRLPVRRITPVMAWCLAVRPKSLAAAAAGAFVLWTTGHAAQEVIMASGFESVRSDTVADTAWQAALPAGMLDRGGLTLDPSGVAAAAWPWHSGLAVLVANALRQAAADPGQFESIVTALETHVRAAGLDGAPPS